MQLQQQRHSVLKCLLLHHLTLHTTPACLLEEPQTLASTLIHPLPDYQAGADESNLSGLLSTKFTLY